MSKVTALAACWPQGHVGWGTNATIRTMGARPPPPSQGGQDFSGQTFEEAGMMGLQ